MKWYRLLLAVGCLAPAVPADQLEFFEKKIRPVLVEKCYACHSTKTPQPMGGLRLDTRDGARAVIEPGDPARSKLITAISYQNLNLKMPPTGKLSDQQIADFTAWITMGAPDPRTVEAAPPVKKGINFAAARKFWSFQPVKDPAPPAVKQPASFVDRFILAKLEEKGLEPAQRADKRTLIRRVTFDLIGLPPTPQEVEDFLADQSPTAFAKVVDRLLASPHYGERWGRHWLDLVRYAETNGHEFDNDKIDAWRYRDYVIRAFNEDVPYNQFVKEHIAGDLLPEKRLSRDQTHWESPLGTSFYWFGEILNSATDSVKSRADEVDNQIDVLSKAFFGLTVACARCHDHKFDPIPTADYYALAGVLHSTTLNETVIDSPEREKQIAAKVQVGQADSLPKDEAAWEDFSRPNYEGWRVAGQAFGPGPMQGVASSFGGSDRLMGSLTSRTFRMPKLYVHVRLAGSKAVPSLKERSPLRVTLVADGHKSEHAMPDGSGAFQWRTMRMTKEIGRLCYFEIVDRSADGYIAVDKIVISDSAKPPANVGQADSLPTGHGDPSIPPSIFATIASDEDPHDVRIHIRGNHQNLGDPAPRRFLQVIAGEDQQPIRAGSGRLEIAERIATADNPLTARVMVNRIWKHHFGYGLVRSTDNFGRTGDAPTHPELLDFLARRFVESGWSVKAMHRLMLLSSAYHMSSRVNPAAAKTDPENKFLHHFPVLRLEAESIRDAILAVAGTLDRKLLGPSLPPYISKFQDGRGKPESGPLDGARRRSIYIQVRRNFLTPMFLAFDYPLPISAIGRRSVSTVPSQALILMNDEFLELESREWAKRVTAEESDPSRRVKKMYQTAFARAPEDWELQEALEFVKTGEWRDLAHVLFNSAEFIYVQ
jgi:cytochrome c553